MANARELSVVVGLLFFGCGSGGTGPDGGTGGGAAGVGSGSGTSVSGSINGRAITARAGAAQRFTALPFQGPSNQGLVVRLSEHSVVCDPAGRIGLAASGARLVTIRIDNPPDAGVVTTGQHSARLEVTSPDCTNGVGAGVDFAADLPVTLTELTGRVRGSFNGNLNSGSPISGAFDVEYCQFYDWEDTRKSRCGP